LIAVVRVSPSDADRELIDVLSEAGFQVSHAQLERWRSFGLLPRHQRQHLGRGRGSSSTLDPGILDLAKAIAARVSATRPIQEITLRVFLECPQFELSEKALKTSLLWFIARKVRKADREAVEALAGFPSVTEEAEDAAAQRIIDFFNEPLKKLPESDQEILRELLPNMPDIALAATLGLGTIGLDRFLELLDELDPSGTDSSIQEMRDAARSPQRDHLFEQDPTLNERLTPSYEAEQIRESTFESIVTTRDLLTEMAFRARMLNSLHSIFPDNSLVRETVERFQETVTGRTILWSYLATEPTGDDWRTDTQTLIDRLTLGDVDNIYQATMLLDELLQGLVGDGGELIQQLLRDLGL
jgi:hypothetical protein